MYFSGYQPEKYIFQPVNRSTWEGFSSVYFENRLLLENDRIQNDTRGRQPLFETNKWKAKKRSKTQKQQKRNWNGE